MFELETTTKAKLIDVDVLSSKNRPIDANPGVALAFSMELTNDALAMFDGRLRSMLYTKEASGGPQQAGLDGVTPVSDTPNLTAIGRKLGRFAWDLEGTGYALTFDIGIGRKASNIELEDVKIDAFHVTPKEGGTMVVGFKAECQDVTEAIFGKLATLKSRDVQIVLTPPQVDQAPLGGGEGQFDGSPFPKPGQIKGEDTPPARTKRKSATDEFVGQHGS